MKPCLITKTVKLASKNSTIQEFTQQIKNKNKKSDFSKMYKIKK